MRPLPHDAAAEAEVLGAVLTDPKLLPDVLAVLDAEAFYVGAHREIFAAVLTLDERGEMPDVLSVCRQLAASGSTMKATVVRDIAADVGISSNAPRHAATLANLARYRRLAGLLEGGLNAALGEEGDPTMLAAALANDLLESTDARTTEALPVAALVEAALSALEHPERGGVPSGFRGLDRTLGGLSPGHLILIAARPGVGKTALATAIARNVAASVPVLFCSLEMSAQEIAVRLLCSEASVDFTAIREGAARLEDWRAMVEAVDTLTQLSLRVVDRPTVKIPEMRAIARRIDGLGLIVVDYLQLMIASRQRQSRQEEVAEISRGLKLLARELGVPVLACSQLNRELERRQDKRPQLSDLRDSGTLEQDSDVVLLLHREPVTPGNAEVIVAKQRNGPTGTVRITFDRASTRFVDRAW